MKTTSADFLCWNTTGAFTAVALKTFATTGIGESACPAVSPEARDSGYDGLLLEHLIGQARSRNTHTLYALSTHTGEWFLERGFQTASCESPPPERLSEYRESGCQSKVFVYHTDTGV
ncbi:amino-acid acetyltransferase domain protein [Neisseria musculi]|uniref:Amino-acid acetyltransferase domain protein n=1 Tax=Neisseria musculi TaxID=1815583 RepID=A0A7H1MEI6_9NEIS|nr:amino-acid acetyltransferase domain protein [Neisseria musculi]